MPNRILREGILTSARVNSLGEAGEVFYRRLMSVVDDYGRFHAHATLLRAALYPLKLDSMRDADVERLLAEVEAAGLLRVYQAGGKRYLEMLDFRQQVRAKISKYPQPEAACCAPVEHLRGMPAASAHLGGDGDEVVSEGGGAAGPAGAEADAHAPHAPLHVRIALTLREQGVAITSAHPLALTWARQGVTPEYALEALALARMRKPQERIGPSYLAPIIEEMLNPPAPRAAAPPAWWASEAATLAKGRELNVAAHPGEAMSAYRTRLAAALEGQRGAGPRTAQAAA